MKRSAEVTVFAGLAALIHVSLFATAPQSGVQSSGAGGQAMVSLTAANATVAEMVETWERPPPPPVTTADLDTPEPPPEVPKMPEFELAEAPQVAVQMALPPPGSALGSAVFHRLVRNRRLGRFGRRRGRGFRLWLGGRFRLGWRRGR